MRINCPADSCDVPVVHTVASNGDERCLFVWCHWCRLLYAFCRTVDGRWDLHRAFQREEETGRWVIWDPITGNLSLRFERLWLDELPRFETFRDCQ